MDNLLCKQSHLWLQRERSLSAVNGYPIWVLLNSYVDDCEGSSQMRDVICQHLEFVEWGCIFQSLHKAAGLSNMGSETSHTFTFELKDSCTILCHRNSVC